MADDSWLSELRSCLDRFPSVEHAFAYGSAIFHQPGLYGSSSREEPMVDFIFAVADPIAWHQKNLEANRGHYSLLGALGPHAVVGAVRSMRASVYFNTRVPWQHGLLKYGVVALPDLYRDLSTWDALYLCGRLHKPVLHLRPLPPRLEEAQAGNLAAALRAALLLLPPRFNMQDLHEALCGLSYGGDVRMGLAEDRQKVQRIAAGSAQQLEALYAPHVEAQVRRGLLQELQKGRWAQDDAPASTAAGIAGLPQAVLLQLAGLLREPAPNDMQACEALGKAAAASGRHEQLLRQSLAAIVRASSRRQALLGLLSAGLGKSARYSAAKLAKAWR